MFSINEFKKLSKYLERNELWGDFKNRGIRAVEIRLCFDEYGYVLKIYNEETGELVFTVHCDDDGIVTKREAKGKR